MAALERRVRQRMDVPFTTAGGMEKIEAGTEDTALLLMQKPARARRGVSPAAVEGCAGYNRRWYGKDRGRDGGHGTTLDAETSAGALWGVPGLIASSYRYRG
jgi:hypothetical protein